MKSSAEVAGTNARLERISAQANTLLATLSAARIAQAAAEKKATSQRARLLELAKEVQDAQDALRRLASDAYIRGAGPLGTPRSSRHWPPRRPAGTPTPWRRCTHLIDARSRLLDQLQSLRSEQVTTSARADSASVQASAAATTARGGSHPRNQTARTRAVRGPLRRRPGLQRSRPSLDAAPRPSLRMVPSRLG